ncbi:MAG TPA: hypothetical protein VFO05_10935 [Candidatus Limnocylindrales bacterium]|nr:hypothetical protein [Candidatus Limnocylindrales bacterium]
MRRPTSSAARPPSWSALSKVLRDVDRDADDVRAMIERRLVDPRRAWGLYRAIAPELPRFPAIDQRSFRDRVERAFGPEA